MKWLAILGGNNTIQLWNACNYIQKIDAQCNFMTAIFQLTDVPVYSFAISHQLITWTDVG